MKKVCSSFVQYFATIVERHKIKAGVYAGIVLASHRNVYIRLIFQFGYLIACLRHLCTLFFLEGTYNVAKQVYSKMWTRLPPDLVAFFHKTCIICMNVMVHISKLIVTLQIEFIVIEDTRDTHERPVGTASCVFSYNQHVLWTESSRRSRLSTKGHCRAYAQQTEHRNHQLDWHWHDDRISTTCKCSQCPK